MAQLFLIDNKESNLALIEKEFGGGHEIERGRCLSSSRTVRELATQTFAELSNYPGNTVLVINVDLTFGQESGRFRGIDLLTWLRISDVTNPAVLYSRLRAQNIGGEKVKNLIAFSPGTTLVEIPDGLRQLDFKALSKKQSSRESVKPFLRAAFEPVFRHYSANWWSLKQLWDAHSIYKGRSCSSDYPLLVKSELRNLANAAAVYLHGMEVVNILDLVQVTQTSLEESRNPLLTKLNAKREDVELLDSDIDNLRVGLKEAESKWQRLRKNGTYSSDYFNWDQAEGTIQRMRTCRENLTLLRKEISTTKKTKRETSTEASNLKAQVKDVDELLKAIPRNLKKEIFRDVPVVHPAKNLKILLVDDLADQGFLEAYQLVLQCQVVATPITETDSVRSIYKKSCDLIDEFDPDIILLDLRLKEDSLDEQQQAIPVAKLSGKVLLDMFRSHYPGLPILVTTASNKVLTRDTLMRAGADGYWVKEGLDERRSYSDSAYNYYKLIELTNSLTSPAYSCLKRLSNVAKDVTGGVGKLDATGERLVEIVDVLGIHLRRKTIAEDQFRRIDEVMIGTLADDLSQIGNSKGKAFSAASLLEISEIALQLRQVVTST